MFLTPYFATYIWYFYEFFGSTHQLSISVQQLEHFVVSMEQAIY